MSKISSMTSVIILTAIAALPAPSHAQVIFSGERCHNIDLACSANYDELGYTSALSCWEDQGAPYCTPLEDDLGDPPGTVFGPGFPRNYCSGRLSCQ